MTVEIFKIRTLREIENNPIYSFSFEKIQNYIKNKNFDKINELDSVGNEIYNYIYNFALREFKYIFDDNLNEYVFTILCLFMQNQNKREIKNFKLKFIQDLLFRYKDNTGHYNSGKLSYLIINLVHFFSFILICFYINIVILQLDKKNLEKLIVKKISVNDIEPNKIKEHFDIEIKNILPELGPNRILDSVLPYVFHPVKDCNLSNIDIEGNNELELVDLEDSIIEDIAKRITFISSPQNLLDIFIDLKVIDY